MPDSSARLGGGRKACKLGQSELRSTVLQITTHPVVSTSYKPLQLLLSHTSLSFDGPAAQRTRANHEEPMNAEKFVTGEGLAGVEGT